MVHFSMFSPTIKFKGTQNSSQITSLINNMITLP